MVRLQRIAFFGLLLCLTSRESLAYPTSIVFTPSAESLGFGEVSAYGYTGVIFDSGGAYPSPFLNPWFGVQVGAIPGFAFGDSGVGFGGIEVGADLIQADQSSEGARGILNLKAQLLTEAGWIPAVGAGIMSIYAGPQSAGVNRAASLNMAYVMLTKSLTPTEALDLGRLHVGYGYALGADAFAATWPFSPPSQSALLAGYESPSFGPFYAAVDFVGGVSEVSSTNFALAFEPSDYASFMAGYTMSNDRGEPYDGLFLNIGVGFNLFGGEDEITPEEPEAPRNDEPGAAASQAPTKP